MNMNEFYEDILANNIQVTPILDTEGILVEWVAGKVIASAQGCRVPSSDIATGASPIEAVEKLLFGKEIR